MKGGLRQSMAWLHTWTGLPVGWVLFFVFLTGTLGYFDSEIRMNSMSGWSTGRWCRRCASQTPRGDSEPVLDLPETVQPPVSRAGRRAPCRSSTPATSRGWATALAVARRGRQGASQHRTELQARRRIRATLANGGASSEAGPLTTAGRSA